MVSKSIQHHPKRSGTRGAQVGPGCSHSPFLGAVSPEGYANQSGPSSRAAPRRAGGSAPGSSWQQPERPRSSVGGSSRSATHSLLGCVVATLGFILDRSATDSVLDAQFSFQTPAKTQICCLLSCAPRLYTDGNVHPRLLPQFSDFRLSSRGVESILSSSASPVRRRA